MRRLSTVVLASIVMFLTMQAKEKQAQSFMFTRPAYARLLPRVTGDWPWLNATKSDGMCIGLQAIGLYQESKQSDKVDRYFLINKKNILSVKGDTAPNAIKRDVRAEWFGLPSNFESEFTMSPRQKQYGAWFELEQELSKYTSCSFFEPLWIGIALPVQQVRNEMQFFEQQIKNPGTEPANMREAFARPQLMFGKVGPKKKTKTKIPEIIFRMGSHMLARDGFIIDLYSTFIIPTQKRQDAEFLFDPFLGHNRHFGFSAGAFFNLPFTEHCSCIDASFFLALENTFFFRNNQYRSIDIKNKPWSRYMLLNDIDGCVINEPAINIFTRKFKVEPFNIVDLSTGLRVATRYVCIEAGYGLWAHGREQITLKDPFPKLYGFAGSAAKMSASESTIARQAADDAEFEVIKNRDIVTESGESRSAVTHTFSGSLALVYEGCSFGIILSGGGFYEFIKQNTALKNWGAWGKIAITL